MELQNEHRTGSSIAELADQCRRSLEACTQNVTLMRYEWAENRLAEFKLWAAGNGVFARDKASLDARLSVNWETKSLIMNLLILLTGCIKRCRTIEVTLSQDETLTELHGREAQGISISIGNQSVSDPIPRPFSPWSESSSTGSESEKESNVHVPLPNISSLQSVKFEVEHMIGYLSRLAAAIRKSGTISRYQKADQLFREEDHQDLFQHLVLVVLSQGSEEGREQYDVDPKSLTTIQKRLIMSNLRRRNRFQYAQRHAQKLAFDALNSGNQFKAPVLEDVVLLDGENNKIQLTKPDNTQVTGEQAIMHKKRASVPTAITATSASAVGTTIKTVPQQTPTLSQIAKSNITSISAKVDYPHPPRLQKGLQNFQCPCCCQTLPSMFRQRTQWKKHLTEDICPYTCFIENCIYPDLLYGSRTDWLRHVEKDHSRCWECLPCRKRGQSSPVFTSTEELITHTKLHHGDSITEEQYPTLISAAARPAPFTITQCPLCDQAGPVDSDELLDHIAEHVHNFSLRSLPWPDETGTHENKPNFFDNHDYFEDGSDCQSYNVSNSSTRDADDLGSLPSNTSIKQLFSTGVDERSAELISSPREDFDATMEEGFTIIYNPYNAKVDIVFIHGVLGNQPCWTSESGVFWPRELLAPKLLHARILSYKYTEKIEISADGIIDASVAELVYGRLIEELAEYRMEKDSKTRPIVFVAHCLGGLILEGAIVNAYDDDSQKELLSCIRGILLLGTPHFKEGLDLDAKKYFEYALDTASKTDSKTENVELPGEVLDFISISQKFIEFKQKKETNIKIKSFRASKGTAVNQSLAQLPNAPKPQLLSCTQLQLSQFEDNGDSDFKQVLRTLTRWLINIDQASDEHNNPKQDEPRVDFSGLLYNSGMQIGSNRSPLSGISFSTTHTRKE